MLISLHIKSQPRRDGWEAQSGHFVQHNHTSRPALFWLYSNACVMVILHLSRWVTPDCSSSAEASASINSSSDIWVKQTTLHSWLVKTWLCKLMHVTFIHSTHWKGSFYPSSLLRIQVFQCKYTYLVPFQLVGLNSKPLKSEPRLSISLETFKYCI